MSTESRANAHRKVQLQRDVDDLSDLRTAAIAQGDKAAVKRLTDRLNEIEAGLDR